VRALFYINKFSFPSFSYLLPANDYFSSSLFSLLLFCVLLFCVLLFFSFSTIKLLSYSFFLPSVIFTRHSLVSLFPLCRLFQIVNQFRSIYMYRKMPRWKNFTNEILQVWQFALRYLILSCVSRMCFYFLLDCFVRCHIYYDSLREREKNGRRGWENRVLAHEERCS